MEDAKKELGDAARRLNTALICAEEKIEQMGYEVEAEVTVSGNGVPEFDFCWTEINADEWGFFVVEKEVGKELLSCSLLVRALAAGAIPELVLAIERKNVDVRAAAEKAALGLEQWLHAQDKETP